MISNASDVIAELTEQQVTKFIPVLCFIALLMLVGSIGNSLVVLTYFRRIGKSSTSMFIFCLAVFDLINCCVGLPITVYANVIPYEQSSHVLCSLRTFVGYSADLSAGYTIVSISFDRYLRFARPHHGIKVKYAKYAILAICFASCLVSGPAWYVYGISTTVLSTEPYVEGKRCGIFDGAKDTAWPLVFNTLILLCFIGGVVILLTMYIRLGIKVRRWNKGRISGQLRRTRVSTQGPMSAEDSSSKNDPSSESKAYSPTSPRKSDVFTFPPIPDEDDTPKECLTFKNPNYVRQISRSLDKNNFSHLTNIGGDLDTSTFEPKLEELENVHMDGYKTLPLKKSISFKYPSEKVTMRKRSFPAITVIKRKVTLSKTTVMFIAATITFVVSHVPYVCITTVHVLHPGWMSSLSAVEYSFVKFWEFSFIFSYGANPLIYSFLNPKFRNECKTLLLVVARKIKCRSRELYFR